MCSDKIVAISPKMSQPWLGPSVANLPQNVPKELLHALNIKQQLLLYTINLETVSSESTHYENIKHMQCITRFHLLLTVTYLILVVTLCVVVFCYAATCFAIRSKRPVSNYRCSYMLIWCLF